MHVRFFDALIVCWLGGAILAVAAENASWVRLPATGMEQAFPSVAPGPQDTLLLSRRPDHSTVVRLAFDLSKVSFSSTPLARLSLEIQPLAKSDQFGLLQAFVTGGPAYVSSVVLHPGRQTPSPVLLDVTQAVAEALSGHKGQLTLEVRLAGMPGFGPDFAVSQSARRMPVLEIVPPEEGTALEDWKRRLEPLWKGTAVYRESCLPVAAEPGREVALKLLFPVARVIEVIDGAGRKLEEGRDWELRDGRIILPAGTRAPVTPESELYFDKARTGRERTLPLDDGRHIMASEGGWYHQKQIAVSYETAAKDLAVASSRPARLSRVQGKLSAGRPIRMVQFGDSISVGWNGSKPMGLWPYQPSWGELTARALEERYGARVEYRNHSQSGMDSTWGVRHAESFVAAEKPDLVLLAFGMNDRGKPQFRANLEKIIDLVRAQSPETEFLVVAPMMNNPRRGGEADILAIRDAILKIERPGVAVVDVTSPHQAMLRRKDYLDMTGNGVNHPNDFLARLYAQLVLESLSSNHP